MQFSGKAFIFECNLRTEPEFVSPNHIPMKKSYILLLLLLLLAACNNNKPKTDDVLDKLDNDTTSSSQPKLDQGRVKETLESMPSPLEISVLLKQSQIRFNKTYLNSDQNTSKYNTNLKRAANLGIYSTDLGYCNIYNQQQEVLKYLDAVKDMAEGLNIGQFFDMTTIRRLATQRNTLDSLLVTTQQNFTKINEHLQEQNRSNLSIMMLTGGWLESLYLTCEAAKVSNDKGLRDRIGQQQKVIEGLIYVLGGYEGTDPFVKDIVTDMRKLQKQYDDVKVVHIEKPATIKEIDGILVVEDNSTNEIEISPETFNNIYETILGIRKKIIG